jgi:hypothetical protein
VQIFEHAESAGIPTYVAADEIAERRIESVGRIQRTYV